MMPKWRMLSRSVMLQLLAGFLMGLMVSTGHRLLLQQRTPVAICSCDVTNVNDDVINVADINQVKVVNLHERDEISNSHNSTTKVDPWLDEQSYRKKTLHDVCGSQPGFPSRDQLPRDLRVNERHKVVYCAIPKVACTTWKGIFLALHNNKTMPEVSRLNVHNRTILDLNDLVSIRHYPEKDIPRILSTYTKMVVVRHPYDRLVSAYADKIFRVNEERNFRYFRPFASRMLRRYRAGTNMSEQVLASGVGVTLEEFLRYITDVSIPDTKRIEDHWMPYQDLCLPCSVNYDYILKLESLQNDTDQVLKRVFNSPLQLKNLNPGRQKSQDKLERLDKTVLKAVYQQYHPDLDMFGYD